MERRSIGSLREIGVLFVALYLSAGVASIVLAVVVDVGLVALQRRLTPWAANPVAARGSLRPVGP